MILYLLDIGRCTGDEPDGMGSLSLNFKQLKYHSFLLTINGVAFLVDNKKVKSETYKHLRASIPKLLQALASVNSPHGENAHRLLRGDYLSDSDKDKATPSFF